MHKTYRVQHKETHATFDISNLSPEAALNQVFFYGSSDHNPAHWKVQELFSAL